MIEERLFLHLSGYGELATLVDQRIYPLVVPQNSPRPVITYQRISTRFLQCRDNDDLQRPRFQFDCYADTDRQSWQVADVLEAALLAFAAKPGTPRIDVTLMEGRTDMYESGTKLHRTSIDAFIWFEKGQ